MKNDPLYQRLLERSWRRELTETEAAELRAWLAVHPEAQADWTLEEGLNSALRGLPNAPVSSNFTALVMQAVEREAARARPSIWRRWQPRLLWIPRIALAAVVVESGLLSYHHFQRTQRVQYAESVVTVSEVASLPGPEILENFDAIRAMKQSPPADEELIALLK
jgi:anti-sigma factor RsiW